MVEEMKYVPFGGGLGVLETVEKVAVDERLPLEALLAEEADTPELLDSWLARELLLCLEALLANDDR